MSTRKKFEWDNNNSPQFAVKDEIYNPEYSKWMEKEYIPELETIISIISGKKKIYFKLMCDIYEWLNLKGFKTNNCSELGNFYRQLETLINVEKIK